MWKPANPNTLHTLKKHMIATRTLAGDSLIASRNGLSSLVTIYRKITSNFRKVLIK